MLGLPEREAAFARGDDDRWRHASHASRHISCIIERMARSDTSDESNAERGVDKNRPLVDDIRLLGRILGDVIREQEGSAAFERVERIRQLAVAYRLKRDKRAGRALDRLLMGLSGDHTVSVIRAFSYFSHLANIAEDRHHLRRRAIHERQGHLQEGSLKMAFERLARRGLHADEIAETLNRAFISPVLTAHPTEVQRKSILDAERAIAELLAARSPQSSASASWPRTRRCCAPASPSSGRRACCAPPSSPSTTRSRTRSATTARPS